MLLLLFSVTAKANTFDSNTNVLTLDSVTVGNQIFTNVIVRLDQYNVISVGSSQPMQSSENTICGSDNFTPESYNAIQIGMSLDQVNQIIGCNFDPNSIVRASGLVVYRWSIMEPNLMFISVKFNDTDLTVTNQVLEAFKSSSGF